MSIMGRSRSSYSRDFDAEDLAYHNTLKNDRSKIDPTQDHSRLRRRSTVALRAEVDTYQVSERPQTAGQGQGRTQAQTGGKMQYKSGRDTFDFPAPSPRFSLFPSIESPRSVVHPPLPSPLDLQQQSTPIGVAIGSPSEMPAWGRSYTADHIRDMKTPTLAATPLPPTIIEQIEQPESLALPKRQRTWKNLRGMFTRKSSKRVARGPSREDDSQNTGTSDSLASVLEIEPEVANITSLPTDPHLPWPLGHHRSPSQRHMARWQARAEADHGTFHPTGIRSPKRTPSMIACGKPIQSMHSSMSPQKPARGSTSPPRDVSGRNRHDPRGNSYKTFMLDVDIPNTEMDRYSIMFERLLAAPQQSLLERRQSRMKRIQLQDNKVNTTGVAPIDSQRLNPQRSMSTIQRSPAYLVTTSHNPTAIPDATRSGQGLKRSNTAPSAVSPARMKFSSALHTLTDEAVSPISSSSSMQDETSLPPTPVSYDHEDDSILISKLTAPSLSPFRREPSWQMMNQSQPSPAMSPTGQNFAISPGLSTPDELDRRLVRISVARQVSVSKARQRVQQAAADKQQVQQPLRPRVVEVNKNGALRKSTVVVIEED